MTPATTLRVPFDSGKYEIRLQSNPHNVELWRAGTLWVANDELFYGNMFITIAYEVDALRNAAGSKADLAGLKKALSLVEDYERTDGPAPKVMPYTDKESIREIRDQHQGIRIACSALRFALRKQIAELERG